ncbi:MAG: putative permease [Rickettsiaceae bacterium]|jgi:predicted permease|nr:putative permease [Rickettsiaceae bacterium]
MQTIFQSILPIFALILIGALSKKLWLKSSEFWRGLEKLSYYLLFPTALFSYISQANFETHNVLNLIESLIFATIIISLVVLRIRQLYSIENAVFTSIFQGAIRYNSYIFLGVASSLYNIEGLSIVAITSGYMMIITNILSILVFNFYIPTIEEGEEISITENIIKVGGKLFTNPLILSCILGFIANYSNMEFSPWINKLSASLANAATAIGVMCVGSGLRFTANTTHIKFALSTCFIKLIALPLVTLFSLKLFNVTGVAKSVGILYSSLPCAGTSYILSQQLGGDPESMAFIITLSIMLSLLSITLIMFMFT